MTFSISPALLHTLKARFRRAFFVDLSFVDFCLQALNVGSAVILEKRIASQAEEAQLQAGGERTGAMSEDYDDDE